MNLRTAPAALACLTLLWAPGTASAAIHKHRPCPEVHGYKPDKGSHGSWLVTDYEARRHGPARVTACWVPTGLRRVFLLIPQLQTESVEVSPGLTAHGGNGFNYAVSAPTGEWFVWRVNYSTPAGERFALRSFNVVTGQVGPLWDEPLDKLVYPVPRTDGSGHLIQARAVSDGLYAWATSNPEDPEPGHLIESLWAIARDGTPIKLDEAPEEYGRLEPFLPLSSHGALLSWTVRGRESRHANLALLK
jgi:hypothetical protein